MSAFALPLGDAADLAATLNALLSSWPDAWRAPWQRLSDTSGAWITTLDLARYADDLSTRGVTVVPCPAAPVRQRGPLVEVLPLQPVPESIPREALFLVPSDQAQSTLASLLRLDQVGVELAEWRGAEGDLLAVRVPDPPLYLLMRARDEAEGVRAFTRQADSSVFVAWGWQHPLAAALAQHADTALLIEPDGWQTGAWPLSWAPLDAQLDALFVAERVDLQPADGPPPRFEIPLRLEEGRPTQGVLWILDAEGFAALAPVIESSAPDALRAVGVTRLACGTSPRYLLRARSANNGVMARLDALMDHPGFALVPGAERIFVPAGMRLVPPMRLSTLRTVLGLPPKGLVVVDQTANGPQVQVIEAAESVPLARWVEYVALDNRQILDAILEEAVFAMPQLELDRPLQTVKRRPPAPRKARPKRPKRARVRLAVEAPEDDDQTIDPELQARQMEAAELQAQIVEGGAHDPALLGRMGELLVRLNAPADAAWCFEAAAFHGEGAIRQQWLTPLLAVRRAQRKIDPGKIDLETDAAVLEAATTDAPSPEQLGLLGVASCARLLHGQPLLDGLRGPLLQIFSDPLSACTRRMAWLSLFELAAATDDVLGATRAKEALLGALNTAGLRDLFDAPSFVRLSLALSGGDGDSTDARSVQAASLESLWSQFRPAHAELDVQAMLYKCTFAIGLARVGALDQARQLAQQIEAELPVHDPPTSALARLYLARLTATGSTDPEAAWAQGKAHALSDLDPQQLRAVQFAQRKSAWLRDAEAARQQATRPHVRRLIGVGPEDGAALIDALMTTSGVWDVEIVEGIHAATEAMLATGKDAPVVACVQAANRAIETMRIPLQAACARGHVLRAQALLDDRDGLDAGLGDLARLLPQIDNLGGVMPTVDAALAALRRVDSGPQVERFLSGLSDMAQRGPREAGRLGAYVADGYRQLGAIERAQAELTSVADAILDPALDHVTRFASLSTLFDVLRSWPSELREATARRMLESLPRFRDSFTTRRYFELIKVLCVERVVDALADTQSLGSGRIRLWLEREEQAVRRRILADWRQIR